jgi:hypothetical protein
LDLPAVVMATATTGIWLPGIAMADRQVYLLPTDASRAFPAAIGPLQLDGFPLQPISKTCK